MAQLWARVLTNIIVRTDLKVNAGGQIAWAVRKENPKLLASLNEFVRTVKKGSLPGNIFIKRFSGRAQNRFGVGYYYIGGRGKIGEILTSLLELDDQQGGEIFYNIQASPVPF